MLRLDKKISGGAGRRKQENGRGWTWREREAIKAKENRSAHLITSGDFQPHFPLSAGRRGQFSSVLATHGTHSGWSFLSQPDTGDYNYPRNHCKKGCCSARSASLGCLSWLLPFRVRILKFSFWFILYWVNARRAAVKKKWHTIVTAHSQSTIWKKGTLWCHNEKLLKFQKPASI